MSVLAFLVVVVFLMVVTVVYAALALRTVWRATREWRPLLDGTYSQRDRDLAWKLGFFLLTPIGVLTHELAHLVTARALGAQHTSLTFWLYWGYVSYAPALSPPSDFAVAAAGPAASIALGLAALVLALRLRRPWQHMFQSFGMATLALVLVVYPVTSYWLRLGDFTIIYATSPSLSMAAGCVHAAGLVAFALASNRLTRRDRTARWAELAEAYPGRLCSFSDKDAARLRALETSWLRFPPGVRQEIVVLRELRDWIAEHNRQVQAAQHAVEQSDSLEGVRP